MNDKTFYITGQLFFLLALFILNTVSARLLGPVQMGLWNLVNLVADYGFIATLGVINGMARDIPLNIGRDDHLAVEKVTFSALVLSVSVVVTLLIAAILVYNVPNNRSPYYVMGILLLVSKIMNSYAYILIRSWQHFTFLGVQQLAMGVLQFVCLLPFLWFRTLPAVLVITVIPLLVGSVFALKYLVKLRGVRFDANIAGRLVTTGFPIYMVGLLYSLFVTTDRLLITTYLGIKPLGLYTPAMIAVSIIALAPTFVANIVYPKLTELYGRTNDYGHLKPYVRKMMTVNVLSTLLLAVVIFLGFKLVVIPYFLPEYAVGLYPMGILLVAAIVSSVGHGFGDVFNAIGMQRAYLINVSCGLAVNAAAGYLLLCYTRLELLSVSLGTLFAVMVYSALQVMSAKRILHEL